LLKQGNWIQNTKVFPVLLGERTLIIAVGTSVRG
jgi:hypothetical protein